MLTIQRGLTEMVTARGTQSTFPPVNTNYIMKVGGLSRLNYLDLRDPNHGDAHGGIYPPMTGLAEG